MQHAQTQVRTHAITQGLNYATFHIMYFCIYLCENVFKCILDFLNVMYVFLYIQYIR